MNGWMDWLIDERMDGWTDGRMDGWIIGERQVIDESVLELSWILTTK